MVTAEPVGLPVVTDMLPAAHAAHTLVAVPVALVPTCGVEEVWKKEARGGDARLSSQGLRLVDTGFFPCGLTGRPMMCFYKTAQQRVAGAARANRLLISSAHPLSEQEQAVAFSCSSNPACPFVPPSLVADLAGVA